VGEGRREKRNKKAACPPQRRGGGELRGWVGRPHEQMLAPPGSGSISASRRFVTVERLRRDLRRALERRHGEKRRAEEERRQHDDREVAERPGDAQACARPEHAEGG